MYLRRCHRAKDGKRHAYWALVKSERTAKGPRQKVVAYLGDLDEAGRLGVSQAAGVADTSRQGDLFEAPPPQPRWMEVDVSGVRVEGTRHFGGPWSIASLVLVICRLCDPSSELRIAEHLYERSALPDLLGELFTLSYDLLLYDVTSTFFEGQCLGNDQAKRGYSRDQRSDCKQVCIGLVVSRCGMPLGYELFAGNKADVSTVKEIVGTMEKRYGKSDRIWVMDRGMVSAANIEFLKEGGRRYIMGTHKALLRKYEKSN